jgi:hypothetical protein
MKKSYPHFSEANADTINWLADNDRWLLQDIVVHNETRERLCR